MPIDVNVSTADTITGMPTEKPDRFVPAKEANIWAKALESFRNIEEFY